MLKSNVLRNPNYNNNKLSITCGIPTYDTYLTSKLDKRWQWSNFFNLFQRISVKKKCFMQNGMSVLEIGRATGGLYKYLVKNIAKTKSSDYTGLDISEFKF